MRMGIVRRFSLGTLSGSSQVHLTAHLCAKTAERYMSYQSVKHMPGRMSEAISLGSCMEIL